MSARAGQSSYDYVVEKMAEAASLIPSKPQFGHKPRSEFEADRGRKDDYILLTPMDTTGSTPINGIIITTFNAQLWFSQVDNRDSTYEQAEIQVNKAYLRWEAFLYHFSTVDPLITVSSYNTTNFYKELNDVLTGVLVNLTIQVQDVTNYKDLCDPC